ncbi:hypothetical protein WR25_14651 [Diploscapter pachys]|uniref:BZIP domain-containing protein n=1 Tax=Diploscapter pachys TaxID=2018661 RepID=A0A2A2LJK9_9BILA|nr:hypothetical protein WR25_14651 [Diploscapter pachys]
MSFRTESIVEVFEQQQQCKDRPLIGDEDPVIIFHSQAYEDELLAAFRDEMEKRFAQCKTEIGKENYDSFQHSDDFAIPPRTRHSDKTDLSLDSTDFSFSESPSKTSYYGQQFLPSPSPIPSPYSNDYGDGSSSSGPLSFEVKSESFSDFEPFSVRSPSPTPNVYVPNLYNHSYHPKSTTDSLSKLQPNSLGNSSNSGPGPIRRGRPMKQQGSTTTKMAKYARAYREQKKNETANHLVRIQELEKMTANLQTDKEQLLAKVAGMEEEMKQLRAVISRDSSIARVVKQFGSSFATSSLASQSGLDKNPSHAGICLHMTPNGMDIEFCSMCNERVANRMQEQTSLDQISLSQDYPGQFSELDEYQYY